MIPPREQWCIQIDVTNACPRRCSNCTRLLAHARGRWDVSLVDFARAVEALADFPAESTPDRRGRRKVVGIIGGEPLLHPQFAELCEIMIEAVPEMRHRGLWTGLRYDRHPFRAAVERLIGPKPSPAGNRDATGGYLNQNLHDKDCFHQPVLVAVQDVVRDEAAMWELIDRCPLQEEWSAAITPKGFFFCEVAGAMDLVFVGPGGLPVTPACWRHDLAAYREQIERWCPRCGVCLPLAGRLDRERVDDVSRSNLETLRRLKSPRILAGDYALFDTEAYDPSTHRPGWTPLEYLRKRA
ncbi:MAG TPA: radical SAM protein [Thermoguttaceae bacterium]|nr:radical SAM protein [Thermoguttaceae bacterium]